MRIRSVSARGSYVIAGGHHAITREVHSSHSCYTFLVEKGNGGAGMGIKFVYIKGIYHYLW